MGGDLSRRRLEFGKEPGGRGHVRNCLLPFCLGAGPASAATAAGSAAGGRAAGAGTPAVGFSAPLRESAPPNHEREIAGPVLALDTTGSLGSVALGFAGAGPALSGLVARTFEPSNRHSRNLLPAIRQVLEEAGVERGDLALMVATRGPGSFTGLRIGLATIQGFALASGIPAVGVSSLDAAALADFAADQTPARRLALVDALRGELFASAYDGVLPASPVAGPVRLSPARAAAWARDLRVRRICGPGVLRYRRLIAERTAGLEVSADRRPLASAALRLGLREAQGRASTLAPLYLREPDIHRRSDTL